VPSLWEPKRSLTFAVDSSKPASGWDWRQTTKFAVRLRLLDGYAFWRGSMKFILEIPDREVFEAAEQPEDLALEIAEVITNEIFCFSSVTVVPQQKTGGTLRVVQA
jgi:hypothetical protein